MTVQVSPLARYVTPDGRLTALGLELFAALNRGMTEQYEATAGKADADHVHPWSDITDTPTTLAGYGIMDGLTDAQADEAYQPLAGPLTWLSSNLTAAGQSMVGAAGSADQTALLDTFTSVAKGLAPASGGGTANFLRADGTWADPLDGVIDEGGA